MNNRPAVIYSDRYESDIGQHVFPTEKYRLVRDQLIQDGYYTEDDFLEPPEADREILLLAHTPEYVADLEGARRTSRTARSELPVTRPVISAFSLAAGGSLLAAKLALERGMALHLGGGLHHAFPDHAEGFCYVNDVAIAARGALREGLVERILVVDVDLHQGNGTAAIFREDSSVFTFSIHQESNYPGVKEKSDLDIGLPDGCDDTSYLRHLAATLPRLRDQFDPGLVLYVAGADPYHDDQLGGLALTREGLRERDRLFFDTYTSHSIPTVVLFAGGYARKLEETVSIHLATCVEGTLAHREHFGK